jgi:hypothetical protein
MAGGLQFPVIRQRRQALFGLSGAVRFCAASTAMSQLPIRSTDPTFVGKRPAAVRRGEPARVFEGIFIQRFLTPEIAEAPSP